VDTVEAAKDKLLTTPAVVGILTHFCAKPVEGTGGIDLLIRKDDDLTGVAINIRLLTGTRPRRPDWKSVNQTVTAGSKALLGMSGGMFVDLSREPRGWSDLAKAADKALAASPETPFLIHVRMVSNE
jgi:hypothetical protein